MKSFSLKRMMQFSKLQLNELLTFFKQDYY